MGRPARVLSSEFKNDLETGILAPLLKMVLNDRDLLLEIRSGYIDIYYKGNGLLKVAPRGGAVGYSITSHDKFVEGAALRPILSKQDAEELIGRIPSIKQQITVHNPHASEIEIEHVFIRMNNNEPSVNSEYFVIDRQGIYGDRSDRFDMLGVCWPRENRRTSAKLDLCIMEVKLSMGADIRKLADQLKVYYSVLAQDLPAITLNAQALLREKIDLGLLGKNDRLKKLRTLDISDRIEDVRCVILLAEQNPFSQSFDPETLSSVPFSKIEIFRVGFGLWSCDAYRKEAGAWHRPAVFGQTKGTPPMSSVPIGSPLDIDRNAEGPLHSRLLDWIRR